MTGFFIKKAFFDGWDNFMSLLIYNVGFMLIFGLFYLSMTIISSSFLFGVLFLVLTNLVGSLYLGTISFITYEFAHYRHEGFSIFVKALKESYQHSILFFFTTTFIYFAIALIIPFYFSYHNIIGYIIAILVLWISILLSLSNMYYFGLAKTMIADKPTKTLKKAFIVVSDNLAFSLFLGIYTIINFVLSIIFAFLIPGFTGISLLHQDAVMLLMYKYDYLETENADRKHIPWDELLFDDRENVGHRSLKGMIFPWKD